MALSLKNIRLKRKHKIIFIIICLLIVFRLFLPAIVLHYCNKSLAHMSGYYGHIEDIDISLYRGAYKINNIYINHVDGKSKKQTEFFKAKTIDLSIEWRALFHRSLVGELVFESPKLVFTRNKTEIADVKKDTNDFRKVLKDFMPLRINRFEVNSGSIHYADNNSSPKVDLALTQTHILAKNLTNATNEKMELPSSIVAEAKAYGGNLLFNMKLNPLAGRTPFDMNAEVKNANLVLINDFLQAYGNFDVNKGTISLYTEFASKKGAYKGYVKPIIKDLDVLGKEDKGDNLLRKIWESIVGLAGNILTNPKKGQVATKVPIEGNWEGSDTDVINAIWSLLRNAFIQALMPSIDNQITLRSIDEQQKNDRNFLQRLFGKKKTEKKQGSK